MVEWRAEGKWRISAFRRKGRLVEKFVGKKICTHIEEKNVKKNETNVLKLAQCPIPNSLSIIYVDYLSFTFMFKEGKN